MKKKLQSPVIGAGLIIALALASANANAADQAVADLRAALESHADDLRQLRDEPDSPLAGFAAGNPTVVSATAWLGDEIRVTEARIREVGGWERFPRPAPEWTKNIESNMAVWENALLDSLDVERTLVAWRRINAATANPPVRKTFAVGVAEGEKYLELLGRITSAPSGSAAFGAELAGDMSYFREVRWELSLALLTELDDWIKLAAPAFADPESHESLGPLAAALADGDGVAAVAAFSESFRYVTEWWKRGVAFKAGDYLRRLEVATPDTVENREQLANLTPKINASVKAEQAAIGAAIDAMIVGVKERHQRNLAEWRQTQSEREAWEAMNRLDMALSELSLETGVVLMEIDFLRDDILGVAEMFR